MLSENNDPPDRKRNLDQGVPTGPHASPEKCSPPESDISTFVKGQMDIQRLLGSIDMGVWGIDAGDITLFLNEAMADMLKYKVDEIAGKNILDFVPEEYRDDAKRFWQRGREGASTQQELQLQCKDGTPCHAIVSASAAVDAGGRLMYSLGFFTDITERKLMGDAIRDRLERYRILIENTNDLVWEVNSDYVYTYLNPRIYDILGYRLEDGIGKKIFNIMPPEEAAKAEDIFHMLENKKVPSFKVEIVCKHHDGHTVYIEISGRPIKDEHGVFRGWRGTARDITRHRDAEIALRKSEEKYRLLTENVNDIIWETDKNDYYTYMSPRCIDVLGQKPESALGKTSFELMQPESMNKVVPAILAAKMAKKPFCNLEATYLHGDGHMVFMELSGMPILDEQGEFMGYRGCLKDITQRRQAEMALEAAKSQAELYVDLMGHDINNMNQITMGFLELAQASLLSKGKLDAEDADMLGRAESSLNNSSRLIDNVRKLQQEKMGLYKPEVLDIVPLVKEVVQQFKHIPGRDMKINVATADHCNVKANELLKDVFINLIGNSIKHSKGSLEVNIGVYHVVRDGRKYCKAIVEDNGPGISDTLKSTLFDRLNPDSTRARGKGFGLCLTKMLIDDYEGVFYVENRVQGDHTKGSRFVVMIPSVEP